MLCRGQRSLPGRAFVPAPKGEHPAPEQFSLVLLVPQRAGHLHRWGCWVPVGVGWWQLRAKGTRGPLRKRTARAGLCLETVRGATDPTQLLTRLRKAFLHLCLRLEVVSVRWEG